MQWLRESEIKHGRICMLAILGVIVPQLGIHLPNYPAEPDWTVSLPKAIEVNYFYSRLWLLRQMLTCYVQANPFGMLQVAFSIAIIEGYYFPENFWTDGGSRAPGMYRAQYEGSNLTRCEQEILASTLLVSTMASPSP
jgi:hypothetical protein